MFVEFIESSLIIFFPRTASFAISTSLLNVSPLNNLEYKASVFAITAGVDIEVFWITSAMSGNFLVDLSWFLNTLSYSLILSTSFVDILEESCKDVHLFNSVCVKSLYKLTDFPSLMVLIFLMLSLIQSDVVLSKFCLDGVL